MLLEGCFESCFEVVWNVAYRGVVLRVVLSD